MIERARELDREHRKGPTELEARFLIVNRAGLTTYGKYRQCLLEIHNCLQSLDRRDPDAKDIRLEEMVRYAEELRGQLGELTPERERKLEEEFWDLKAKQQLAIDLICGGRPTQSTMELLIHLPDHIGGPLLGRVVEFVRPMLGHTIPGEAEKWLMGPAMLEK